MYLYFFVFSFFEKSLPRIWIIRFLMASLCFGCQICINLLSEHTLPKSLACGSTCMYTHDQARILSLISCVCCTKQLYMKGSQVLKLHLLRLQISNAVFLVFGIAVIENMCSFLKLRVHDFPGAARYLRSFRNVLLNVFVDQM